jgi:gliding motility-associated-like protein
LFTPDNNGLNDLFRPVLSFTPVDYQLIITDANRKTVFETKDYSQEWDGTRNGDHLPEGLYLWFLRIRTPSGRIVEKSGTITIKLTR